MFWFEDKERKEKKQAEVQSEKEAKDDTVFSEIEQDFGVKEWEGEIWFEGKEKDTTCSSAGSCDGSGDYFHCRYKK